MIQNNTETDQNPASSDLGNTLKKLTPPTVQIKDILALTLRYWYWILLFILVCLAYAWFSIQKTVPLYSQSTSVLLRDNVEGNGTGSSNINLADLGIRESYTILEDEMEALRSPDLMEQVVVALNLTTSYRRPGRFHDTALYGSTLPIRVSFPDIQPDETASMRVKINADGRIEVAKLKVNGEPYKLDPEADLRFGDAILTPAGKIIFQKTPFYKEGEETEVIVNHIPLSDATARYGGEIKVDYSANKHSNVVEVSCVDSNLQRADEILAMLLKCYTQNWLRGKADVVAATNDFITQRLISVESELNGVDSSISEYKSSNLVPDVSQASSMAMQQSNEATNQVMNYQNQLQMARYLKTYISSESKNSVLPVNTGISGTNVEGLITQYNSLVLQRNSLLENTSEANPIIIDLDSRLASMRTSILASIDNAIVSLGNSLATMERREQTQTARVAASPQQAKFLLSAERKQKVQENLYLYLLQKREENQLSQASVSINTRILRKPSGSTAPITPRPQQTYLIAFIIGLVVPVGTIYLKEMSNNKVRGRKDLEGMSVPVVGEIPRFKKSGRKKVSYFKGEGKERIKTPLSEEIVVEDGNRDVVNEAMRVLRSNVTRMTGASVPSVIMVTSFNPGSGKTFMTMNLGISLALKQHKVLLIDGDLRRASLSKFARSPRKGMADYLSGALQDVDSVIKKDCITQGLDILPVGALPPNPTELLETQRFVGMMDYLRNQYEYIFIDCPPGEIMADAQIVSDVADRTLFVIRVGLFQRPMLPEVERLYENKKYPNMMIVLNDSYSGARYGYSYSYGYGYSRKGKYGYQN